LNYSLETSTRLFQLALQVGWLEHADLIYSIVGAAKFKTDAAREIASVALVNYFAAALLMPYREFVSSAEKLRHDIVRLSHKFGTSFEQVCHRLSTLQRPGEKGIPIYFFKVDRAGNIVKRHSATRFHFARFGGSCPLWNVHEAFETPDRILIQQAEMPDGTAYLCLAKAIVKPARHYGGATQRYAIGLGCALADAANFVYADTLEGRGRVGLAKIGINCRMCPRVDCAQRSEPPLSTPIAIDPTKRGVLPYEIGA
jgi:predicted transcriptional regulator